MAEALRTVSTRESRGFTNALLELVDEGMIDRDELINDLLRWMSESDVEQFCRSNLSMRDEDNECIIHCEED